MADQQKIFFEKLNTDKEGRTLEPGEFMDAWNIHIGYTEENKSGIPSNIKGMVEISWPLPGGQNKVIGSTWDDKTQANYVFVYNSNLDHHILKHSPNNGDLIQVLMHGDFLEMDADHLITGLKVIDGRLLYWTDYFGQPHKLNIDQALAKLNPASYTMYIPWLGTNTNPLYEITFDFTPYDASGVQQSVASVQSPSYFPNGQPANAQSTPQGLVATLVALLSGDPQFSVWFSVAQDGTEIVFTPLVTGATVLASMSIAGGYPTGITGPWALTSGGTNPVLLGIGPLLTVPTGGYAGVFTSDLITWRKLTPSCEPTATIGADPTRAANRLSRLVFQFAIFYRYHDGEKTPLSAYSDLAYDTLGGCDVSSQSLNNYFLIDFDDPLLTHPGMLSILKEVEICFRIGNTGAWKSAKVIPKQDFLYDRTWQFYNDGVYAVLDPAYAVKIYDIVPLKAKSAEFIADANNNNRALLGGEIEGYNNQKIDAKIDLSFAPEDSGALCDLTGLIRIINPFYAQMSGNPFGPTSSGYWMNGPIHNPGSRHQGGIPAGPNTGIVFGGLGQGALYFAGQQYGDLLDRVGTKWDQWLPEAGWYVYLPGTPYGGMSEQINTAFRTSPSGAQITPSIMPKNVFDTSALGIHAPGGLVSVDYWTDQAALAFILNDPNSAEGVYSEWTIRGVSPGRYPIRIPSHLCSYGDVLGLGANYDLDSPTRSWQKTSTYLMGWNLGASTGVPGVFYSTQEVIVTIESPIAGATTFNWRIEVEDDNGIFVLINSGTGSVNGPNTQIEIGTAWIADCTNPMPAGATQPTNVQSGYLVDNNGNDDVSDPGHPLSAARRMELQRLFYTYVSVSGVLLTFFNPIPPGLIPIIPPPGNPQTILNLLNLGRISTDHNGFFWFGFTRALFDPLAIFKVTVLGVTADPANPSGVYFPGIAPSWTGFQVISNFGDAYYEGYLGSTLTLATPAVPGNLDNDLGHHPVVLYAQGNPTVQAACNTKVIAKVVNSQGVGIPGVNVVSTRGGVTTTDSFGQFEMTVWGDNSLVPGANFNNRLDTLCFSGIGRCLFQFTGGPVLSYNINSYQPGQFFSALDAHSLTSPSIGIGSMTFTDLVAVILSGQLTTAMKRRIMEQFGYIFKDDAGRTSAVQTLDALKVTIPYYNQDLSEVFPGNPLYPSGTFAYGNPILTWTINSGVPIPEFGRFTHLQWMRTRNTPYYLQWVAKKITYASGYDEALSAPIPTNYNSNTAKEIYIDIGNLTDYRNQNADSMLGYTYTVGDRIWFIRNENGAFYNEVFDFPIRGMRGNWVIIEAIGTLPELKKGCFFELYTPSDPSTDNKPYYEIPGECIEILDPYGPNPTLAQTTGIFATGNTWKRIRQMPALGASFTYAVEDPSISDFWSSNAQPIGRVNREDPDAKQLDRATAIRVSNVFQPGSNSNGLSAFEGLNIKVYPTDYGLIQKLFEMGDICLVICQNSRSAVIYIGQVTSRDVQGQFVFASTDDVLGNSRPSQFRAGTQNPESLVYYNGKAWWLDMQMGQYIQYDNNGNSAVSDYGMKMFFARMGRTYFGRPNIQTPGVYDRFFGMAMITFPSYDEITSTGSDTSNLPPTETIIHHEGFTVGYQDSTNSWVSFFNWTPEMFQAYGQHVISFLNGRLWRHNENVSRGTFYGTFYPAKLKGVANAEPSKVKRWIAIILESLNKWSAVITNNRGQRTTLSATEFRTFEGQQKATIKRDINTVNVAQARLNGKEIRSEFIEVEITYSGTDETSIFAVDTHSTNSERTDK